MDNEPIEIKTYADLLSVLETLSDSELRQPIQCVSPKYEDVTEMLPAISLGTMDNLELETARSTHNNKFNPDDVVILLDHNPFGKGGEVAYELATKIDSAGDWLENAKPIYGKDGPTSAEDQINPKSGEYSKYHDIILRKRLADNDRNI